MDWAEEARRLERCAVSKRQEAAELEAEAKQCKPGGKAQKVLEREAAAAKKQAAAHEAAAQQCTQAGAQAEQAAAQAAQATGAAQPAQRAIRAVQDLDKAGGDEVVDLIGVEEDAEEGGAVEEHGGQQAAGPAAAAAQAEGPAAAAAWLAGPGRGAAPQQEQPRAGVARAVQLMAADATAGTGAVQLPAAAAASAAGGAHSSLVGAACLFRRCHCNAWLLCRRLCQAVACCPLDVLHLLICCCLAGQAGAEGHAEPWRAPNSQWHGHPRRSRAPRHRGKPRPLQRRPAHCAGPNILTSVGASCRACTACPLLADPHIRVACACLSACRPPTCG